MSKFLVQCTGKLCVVRHDSKWLLSVSRAESDECYCLVGDPSGIGDGYMQCCCPQGKSLSLRVLRTNLQVLVLILVFGLPVLDLGPQNPQKLSRTLHSANSVLHMITWRWWSPWKMLWWRMAYVLISDITYCCCPWGSSRTSLQVLVLILIYMTFPGHISEDKDKDLSV